MIGIGLAPDVCPPADEDTLRFGDGVNLGATYRLHTNQGDGLEIDHLSQSSGFSLGVELSRYIGIELAANQSQSDLMEVKDRKPRGRQLGIRGDNVAAVGALGGGIDYLVATNIALGLEAEDMISRGHSMTVAGDRPQTIDLDALLMTGGLRIFFGKGSPR